MRKYQPSVEVLEGRLTPAQFVSVTSAILGDGSLYVKFQESGITKGTVVNEVLTGDASASYQWFNKGGKTPAGSVFQSPTVQLDVEQLWSVYRGWVAAAPPPPTAEFQAQPHASGWVEILTVSYTNLVLTDATYGDSIAVPSVSGTVKL